MRAGNANANARTALRLLCPLGNRIPCRAHWLSPLRLPWASLVSISRMDTHSPLLPIAYAHCLQVILARIKRLITHKSLTLSKSISMGKLPIAGREQQRLPH